MAPLLNTRLNVSILAKFKKVPLANYTLIDLGEFRTVLSGNTSFIVGSFLSSPAHPKVKHQQTILQSCLAQTMLSYQPKYNLIILTDFQQDCAEQINLLTNFIVFLPNSSMELDPGFTAQQRKCCCLHTCIVIVIPTGYSIDCLDQMWIFSFKVDS